MAHNQYPYDQSHSSHQAYFIPGEDEISRRNTSSSTQPLIQQNATESIAPIQHSATFYPTSNDEFYTPYADWNDDLVSSPVSYTANPISPDPYAAEVNHMGYGDSVTRQSSRASVLDRAASIPYGSADVHDDGHREYPASPPVGSASMSNTPIISPPVDPDSSSPFQNHSLYPPPVSETDDTITSLPSAFPYPSTPLRSTVGVSHGSSGPIRKKTVKSFMPSVQEDSIFNADEGLYGNSGLDSKKAQVSHVDPLQFIEEGEGGGRWVKRTQSQMRRSNTVLGKAAHLLRSVSRRGGGGNYHGVFGDEPRILMKEDRALALRRDEERAETQMPYEDLPDQVKDAMISNHGNTNLVYTEAGEAVDLSFFDDHFDKLNVQENEDCDTRPLMRASTGMNAPQKSSKDQSYYFPPDPDMPNWKPLAMRPAFIAFLQVFVLGTIAMCEFLYQISVKKGAESGAPPYLTKFKKLEEMNLLDYALWKYLPTVVAVIFGVLVQVTDAAVKRVEPYFQLSRRPKGAKAADSLNIEYLTFWAILCPLQAFRHKHWAVLLSSLAAILSFAAVPPLQSAFLDLNPDDRELRTHKDLEKQIVVDDVWTRLLEFVLSLIFLLLTALQVLLWRRKSGLTGDPSGIAGVAAMAVKSHILMDFKGLDHAGTDQIHKQLSKRTYILHKSSIWQAEFVAERDREVEEIKAENPHPLLFRLEGGIPFIIYLTVCAVLVPCLVRVPIFEGFISKTAWLLTALSISLKMFWEIIDRDLRVLQPFWELYNRHADPEVLTLDYSATIPGYMIYKAFKNGHTLLGCVSIVSILNEVLTVCMGSLDQSGGEETARSSNISLGLSVSIIILQIIGVISVLYFRRQPFLPRPPATISSVLAYIYQSHMLTDFVGLETATTEERAKVLKALGKTYGFGWFKGLIDGRWHLGIDQEELERPYTHGEKFLQSNLQGVPTGFDQYE